MLRVKRVLRPTKERKLWRAIIFQSGSSNMIGLQLTKKMPLIS